MFPNPQNWTVGFLVSDASNRRKLSENTMDPYMTPGSNWRLILCVRERAHRLLFTAVRAPASERLRHSPSHCSWWQSHPRWSDTQSFSMRFLTCRHTLSRQHSKMEPSNLKQVSTRHLEDWVTLCNGQTCAQLGLKDTWPLLSNEKEAALTHGNGVNLTLGKNQPQSSETPAKPRERQISEVGGSRGCWGWGLAEDGHKGAQRPFWEDGQALNTQGMHLSNSLKCTFYCM